MSTLGSMCYGDLCSEQGLPRAGHWVRNVATIARRELRDSVGGRGFVLYTLAFAALGLGVSYVSAATSGGAGLSGYGRTTAGLINIVLLVVPLMALTSGAASISSDRERGMLAYMLAQPISRSEVLLGKYLGLAGSLAACITLGLGASASIMAWKGQASSPAAMVWIAGLTLGLGLAMLSTGLLMSVLTSRASVAVGIGVFLWLVLVFATDLALMAGTIALKLRVQDLFLCALANPLQVFKMWSLHSVDATLDVLGPVGLYASEEYGHHLHVIFVAAMGIWIVVPLAAASVIFSRRSAL